MIATPTIRIGRLADGDQGPCQAKSSPNCPDHAHKGTYRIEAVNPTTGEVWRREFCTATAGAWCHKRELAFPPGMWAATP